MVADDKSRSVPRLDTALAFLGTLAALALAHGRRLVVNFGQTQWEDAVFFRYTRAHVHSVVDAFRLPGPYPGLYRPLSTNLFYFAGQHLFGERIAGYHLVILAVFVLNAVLLHRIAFRLMPSRWALLAPVLWASRLANVEVVTHSCEFQGLLSATGVLLAVEWFAAGRPGLSTAAAAVALLAKETALVLPILLLAVDMTIPRPRPRARAFVFALLGPLAVTVVWIGVSLAISIVRPHAPTGFGYDPSPANVLYNLTAYLLAFSNLLVGALATPAEWVMPATVGRLAAHPAVQVLVALAVAALMANLVVIFRRRARPPWPAEVCARFGITWFLIAILPVALFRDRLFMRYAYLAHAGLALAACAAAAAVGQIVRGWLSSPAAQARDEAHGAVNPEPKIGSHP